jgi:probable HAF family extracellular repeat protein
MKFTKFQHLSLTGAALTGLALAAPSQALSESLQYHVQDLGAVGSDANQPGQPFVISSNGWVSGGSLVGGAEHAVLWHNGELNNIGGHGLGSNSIAFGVNQAALAVGETEDSAGGSTTEDFCGFQAMGFSTAPTPCVPFLWKNNKMVPLQTLGGLNGVANQINSWGAVAGYAENTTLDSACSAPQKYQFKPVIWYDQWVAELPTGSDPEGVAFSINQRGQAVGATGACAAFSPVWLFNLNPVHAMLWQDGKAVDLGNLGGAMNNLAHDINDSGDIVGGSDLAGDQTGHAFLWTQDKKMVDLGTVSGDFWSVGLGINDQGRVVGTSANADFSVLRAFVRDGGKLLDLNSLKTAGDTALFLETACSINAKGEIIGLAINLKTGSIHAYLASPIR